MSKESDKYPNLKPFKPGQSGNPAGMKKGTKRISTNLKKMLDMRWTGILGDGEKVEQSGAAWQAIQIFLQAFAGDPKAQRMLLEYTEGKPLQPLDHDGAGKGTGVPAIQFITTIEKDPQETK